MRKRTLLLTNLGKPLEEANYADICFYDKENDNKIIVSPSEINSTDYPLSRFTPIGVVAVPSSHTDEKRPRIISLKDMDDENPDNGSNSTNGIPTIYWGNDNGLEVLPYKDKFPQLFELAQDSEVSYDYGTECELPSDLETNFPNPLNSNEWFVHTRYAMCSPYKEDGSKEPRYFDSSETANVLADFDGKSNTELILAEDNSISTDWQTAETVNKMSWYVHNAAQCTWRYHTDGTKQGDWYLPSAGELGYATVRKVSINNSINLIRNIYSSSFGVGINIDNSPHYWTSTQESEEYAVLVDFDWNNVYGYSKTSYYHARAFLKI